MLIPYQNHEPQNTKHKIFQLTEKFLEIVRNSSITLNSIVILLVAFTPLSCKKKTDEPPLKEMNSNESYVSVIKSYNYFTKNSASLKKNSEVGLIPTDSVPIILDILLNYNETENSGILENMEILEFQYDISSNAENRSIISHLDSLYEDKLAVIPKIQTQLIILIL